MSLRQSNSNKRFSFLIKIKPKIKWQKSCCAPPKVHYREEKQPKELKWESSKPNLKIIKTSYLRNFLKGREKGDSEIMKKFVFRLKKEKFVSKRLFQSQNSSFILNLT